MSDNNPQHSGTLPPRSRLAPMDRDRELYPLRRARELTRCFLYWIPVQSFPLPVSQKLWVLALLDRLTAYAIADLGLRVEVFLQVKATKGELKDALMKGAREFFPVMGLSRRPNSRIPPVPTKEDLLPIQQGRKEFKLDDFYADYCYWFMADSKKEQRQSFFGYGGVTLLFLKPDPKTAAPKLPTFPAFREHPAVRMVGVDRLAGVGSALADRFLSESKKLFGGGLETEAQYEGLPFIIPLLGSRDFFSQPAEDVDNWFRLCDLYFNESPADEGLLLASKTDIEDWLIEALGKMKQEGLQYPDR